MILANKGKDFTQIYFVPSNTVACRAAGHAYFFQRHSINRIGLSSGISINLLGLPILKPYNCKRGSGAGSISPP